MAYIPKNKIQSNLYTSGITEPGVTLLSTKSGELYVGYFHKLYNNKIFSGKTPNDLNKQELFLRNTDGSTNDSPRQSPTLYSPLNPTPQDYQNGEFVRYFICRINQPFFIEIDKTTFDRYKQKDPTISWKLYKPFSLFWVLTGDINQVAQTNKNVTEFTEQKEKVDGLSLYLKENWTQYYKSNP